VLKEAHPALTRAGGVRFPGNPLYVQHSSVTTEEYDKRRDMPVLHLLCKLSWDERCAEDAEGPVRLRGGALYSRVAQLEAQRPLKSLVAGSTPAPGTDPVSASGRPTGFEPVDGRSIRSTGTGECKARAARPQGRAGEGGTHRASPDGGRGSLFRK
jgi:hypothetical protein